MHSIWLCRTGEILDECDQKDTISDSFFSLLSCDFPNPQVEVNARFSCVWVVGCTIQLYFKEMLSRLKSLCHESSQLSHCSYKTLELKEFL